LLCTGEWRKIGDTNYMTEFFLWMSVGGVWVGCSTRVFAPSVFPIWLCGISDRGWQFVFFSVAYGRTDST